MGNLSSSLSCIKIQTISNSKNIAKLVDSSGQMRLVNLPTTVAELMLENPGFVLTPVEELERDHRIPAMRADDELLGRKVYLLVPVDKVNSRLSDLQLAAIKNVMSLYCDHKVGKRTRGSSKVSPSLGSTGLAGQNLEEFGGNSSNTGAIGQRKRICYAWRPVLEPILEEC
ncbi:uncharacterized protein LOC104894848 [Beta vulgaris subsp. vulgaris]|uniref:uncharacterized protein LOC104894848 n=1 Tax=Beta vulgaris subsp. vulgaris TaxID=3555 RepID=UPI0020375404|nr:uncharacterized protein LOC104894848 [Beta vulgaris subsp. vulgaris]